MGSPSKPYHRSMNTWHNNPTLTRLNRFLITALTSTLFASAWAGGAKGSLDSETMTLPVRVFLAKSEVSNKINCTMSEEDLAEVFTVVNENWAPANIHWSLESVQELRVEPNVAHEYQESLKTNPRRANMKVLIDSFPNDQRLSKGFNVFIVESMGKGAGGVFRPKPYGDVIYAHQSPRGFAVPAILAHELGHALSLPHTVFEKNNNLMMGSAPGRKPTRVKPLTASQIHLARIQAKQGKPFSPKFYKSPSPKKTLFAKLDVNSDGTLTAAENGEAHQGFVRNLLRQASRAPHESLNKDEFDLMQMRRNRNQQGSGSNGRRVGPSIDSIFAKGDANQDGKLSRDEASGQIPPRNFAMSDKDEDGFITKEDILATRKRFGLNVEGFRIQSRPE